MESMKKLLVGGLCLLVCTLLYAWLPSVRSDPRQANLDSLARMYFRASPYALVTPVTFDVHTPVITFPEGAIESVPKAAPVAAADRLTEYVNLHKSRIESLR